VQIETVGSEARVIATIFVEERTFQTLACIQELAVTDERCVIIRCRGSVNSLIACARQFDSCIIIVEASAFLNGSDAELRDLARWGSEIRILARVEDQDPPTLEKLILAGCFGFITGETSRTSLRELLEAVHNGEMWVDRALLSRVFQQVLLSQTTSELSTRECEILALLGEELTNKTIGERLYISQETLRWHLRNLYSKTHIPGRGELVRYAKQLRQSNRLPPCAPPQRSRAPRCGRDPAADSVPRRPTEMLRAVSARSTPPPGDVPAIVR
jgi:DNA-binding NarL/FixJ family response regulator